jgi:hypothetical protein
LPDGITVFTLILALATIFLGIAAGIQINSLRRAERISADSAKAARDAANAATDSVNIARDSSISQLRAYVFLDNDQIAENLRVAVGEVPTGMFRFKNFGLTPANNLTVHITSGAAPWPLAQDVKLPPLPTQTKGTQVAPPGAVTFWALEPQGYRVPAEDFDQMKIGKLRFYVWGWATYTDVFGKERFTNFCLAILPPTDPKSGSGYGIVRCPLHNDYS